jgi:hypothetical protein
MDKRGMKWLIPILLTLASSAAANHNWEHRDIVGDQRLYADACVSCHGANLEGQSNWQSRVVLWLRLMVLSIQRRICLKTNPLHLPIRTVVTSAPDRLVTQTDGP